MTTKSADEQKQAQSEQPETPKTVSAETGQVTPQQTVFSQEQVNAIVQARLADARRQADEETVRARKKAEDESAAKNGEWQKLAETRAAELEKTKLELASQKRNALCQSVAAKYGIPHELAERLRGETAEEIEADAKEIKKLLGDKSPKSAPVPGTTGSGDLAVGETEEQKRGRLNMAAVNVFDPTWAAAHGGGVLLPRQQEK